MNGNHQKRANISLPQIYYPGGPLGSKLGCSARWRAARGYNNNSNLNLSCKGPRTSSTAALRWDTDRKLLQAQPFDVDVRETAGIDIRRLRLGASADNPERTTFRLRLTPLIIKESKQAHQTFSGFDNNALHRRKGNDDAGWRLSARCYAFIDRATM